MQVLHQERATGGCLQKDDTTPVTHSWLNSSFNSEHRVCRRCTLYFTVANFRFHSIESRWQKQRRMASESDICVQQPERESIRRQKRTKVKRVIRCNIISTQKNTFNKPRANNLINEIKTRWNFSRKALWSIDHFSLIFSDECEDDLWWMFVKLIFPYRIFYVDIYM